QDLGRRPALVLAVVPLGQVLTELRDIAEAGEPAGLEAALQRAGQHVGELPALEEGGERRRLPAAPLRQRHVRPARVTALDRPLGITVKDEDNLLAVKGAFVHALRLSRRAPAQRHERRARRSSLLPWPPNPP